MSTVAIVLIILSALLHALWNLVAKKGHMSYSFYCVMSGTCSLFWSHVLLWTPINISTLPPIFWVFTICTVLSDVLMYCLGLTLTYRCMEMSTAYPIMRSLPILLTMCITHVLVLGNAMSHCAILGCVIVFTGCMMMPLKKFSDFKLKNYWTPGMLFVLLTACGTTGYTIFDREAQALIIKLAPEVSATARSLTFYIMRSYCLTVSLILICLLVKSQREDFKLLLKHLNWQPFFCGVCASSTYALVLVAMNFVSNVTYVQCFRQLGLPFGLLLGIVFLKEKCTRTKLLGVLFILAGLVLTLL